MKQISIYFLVGIMVWGLSGCLGFDCTLKDNFEGFDDLTTISEAEIQTIVLDVSTLNVDTLIDGKIIIIDDTVAYNDLKIANEDCDLCMFPNIDFETRTLLGVYYQVDCSATGISKIERTNMGYKHYTKAVNTTRCEFFGCYNYSFGWHTIPKIDSTVTIETNFSESYYQCDCD